MPAKKIVIQEETSCKQRKAPRVYPARVYSRVATQAFNPAMKKKHQSYEVAGDLTVSGSATTRYLLNTGVISTIPKYRNDTLASVGMANLYLARQSDKIYLRNMHVHISALNTSTKTTYVKIWLFRNTSPNEVPATVAAGAGNWFKDDFGAVSTMAVPPFYATAQPLNTDFWDKKKDLVFVKTIKMSATNDPNGNDIYDRSFRKKLGYSVRYESKGDSTSAAELRGGNYYLLMAAYNNSATGASGGITSVAVKLITNYSEP